MTKVIVEITDSKEGVELKLKSDPPQRFDQINDDIKKGRTTQATLAEYIGMGLKPKIEELASEFMKVDCVEGEH